MKSTEPGPQPDRQRVLITGCGSGLGRLTARFLAAQGMIVFATMRDRAQAAKLTAGAGGRGDLYLRELDVCSGSSVAAAMASVNRIAGGLEALICNAGVELRGPPEYVSQEELRWQFDTNVFGAHRVVRAVLPDMRRRGSGRLVFISSVLGRAARPWLGAYSASKFALEGLAETLYLELRPFGVKVSLAEPGRFPSSLGSHGRRASGWEPDNDPYSSEAASLERAVAALEPAGYEPDIQAMVRDIAKLLADPAPSLRLPLGADAVNTTALLGSDRFDTYARLFENDAVTREVNSSPAESARSAGTWRLPRVVQDLASSIGPAVLTTLMPDGQPQAHVIWVDHDDDHLLVNTEIHRRKYQNMLADPRVTLTLIDGANPHHYAEIRGQVAGFLVGQDARDHIDFLSRKYRGRNYDPGIIRSERVVARIRPTRVLHINGTHVRTLT